MRNAECGIDRAAVEPRSELAGSTSALQFRIAHSALRIRGGAGSVRVVLQRVSRAEVRVDGRVTGKIGVGFLVLAGFAPTDSEDALAWMADKVLGLRVFGDAEGKMNLALADVGGALLVVSQFTLYGDAKKGRRPSFVDAAAPEVAIPLYDRFVALIRERGAGSGVQVATGEFGAMMEVELVNDGPVTLILEK